MKLKIGKIRLNYPDNPKRGKRLVHIDYILKNKTTKAQNCELVVFRAWSFHRQRWLYYVEPLWVLILWNK